MIHLRSKIAAAAVALLAGFTSPAFAAGDLLVAPTRLVLGESGRGEVLLSNKGRDSATYRTSIVLRRMGPDGQSVEITQPTPEQQRLIDMVSYAPRRVILAPGQTQTVRVAARVPEAWPTGEYRVHMLFRAVPDDSQAIGAGVQDGVSIALTPVYGVTIPVVVRKGALDAQVGISNVRMNRIEGRPALTLDLTRTGNRSIYGTIRLFRPGIAGAIAEMRGVAVYDEIDRRSVIVPLPEDGAAQLRGPLTVRFAEESNGDGKATAEATVTL